MAQQQATEVTVLPGNSGPCKFPHRLAIGLGISQIVFGSLAFIFTVVAIAVYSRAPSGAIGTGIWCGIIFIITGIFGVLCNKLNRNRCHIIAFMVLSIISAVFCFFLLIMSIIGIMLIRSHDYLYNNGLSCEIILLIISLAEATVSIISSAFCCRAMCGCCNQQPVYIYPTQGQFMYPPNTVHQLQDVSVPYPNTPVYNQPTGAFMTLSPNQQPHGAYMSPQNPDMFVKQSFSPASSQVPGQNPDKSENHQYNYTPLLNET